MRGRQEVALDPDRPSEQDRDRFKRVGGLVLASGLLLTGIGIGADQGARLIAESLQVMASGAPDRLVDKPLGTGERRPMVSEPYRPERLKDFEPPEPVPERRDASGPASEGQSAPAEAEPERQAVAEPSVSCSGGVLERDICADPRLVSLHRRIGSAISGETDPRYQEYLRQRERWCAPQPSRANRQECLRDVAGKLLGNL